MWRLQAKQVHYCVVGFNQQTQKHFWGVLSSTRLSYLVFVCNITFCPICWMVDLTEHSTLAAAPLAVVQKNTLMNLPEQIKHELADSTGLQARDWRQAKHRTSEQNHSSVFVQTVGPKQRGFDWTLRCSFRESSVKVEPRSPPRELAAHGDGMS